MAFIKNPLTENDNRTFVEYTNDVETRTKNEFDATKIEEGSNENGRWIKFPDGTMICHHAHGRNMYEWSIDASAYNHRDITLPQSFVGDYTVEIHGIPHNDSVIPRQAILVAEMFNSNTFRMRGLAIQGFTVVRGFGYTAIGRWK